MGHPVPKVGETDQLQDLVYSNPALYTLGQAVFYVLTYREMGEKSAFLEDHAHPPFVRRHP